jgi:hypothetical protein
MQWKRDGSFSKSYNRYSGRKENDIGGGLYYKKKPWRKYLKDAYIFHKWKRKFGKVEGRREVISRDQGRIWSFGVI